MTIYKTPRQVKVGNFTVGAVDSCFVIAEIGGNFRDLETGKKLVDLAASAGADAIKWQTFKADTITTKKAMFYMGNTGEAIQWEHFKKFELEKSIEKELCEYVKRKGLAAFSTPSHPTDIDLLEELGVDALKIGSDDAVNIPFLKGAARTGKPILLSTGMCTMGEVEKSVDAILEEGNDNLILFHCTTDYPTKPESVNLLAMKSMVERFNFPVGYSDHTLGIDICYAAAVMGATVLEFHFTYDKNADGPDHMLSKTPEETVELIKKVRLLPTLLGDGIKRPVKAEMNTRRNNRKSIVLIKDVRVGEKISKDNIEIKRPGYGIPCACFENVLGKTASKDLYSDDVLNWEDVT